MVHDDSPYSLAPASLNIYSDSVTFDIKNKHNGLLFVVKVEGVKVKFRQTFSSLEISSINIFRFISE